MFFAAIIQDMFRVRHDTKGAEMKEIVHWRKRRRERTKKQQRKSKKLNVSKTVEGL